LSLVGALALNSIDVLTPNKNADPTIQDLLISCLILGYKFGIVVIVTGECAKVDVRYIHKHRGKN